jgi:hydroxymethylbilane synthase
MARIVLGHRDGALATRQARTLLSELAAEWPDLQIVLRQVAAKGENDTLLAALQAGSIGIALAAVDSLPATLPDDLTLAAVGRRLEPRMALVSRGRSLAQLEGARVRVATERDLAFLRASLPQADAALWTGTVDAALAALIALEFEALILPGALLIALNHRERIDALLDAEVFPPAPGQGAMGLVVRSDDDAAAELAYSLLHRPSFARVRAERAFAAGVGSRPVGALASVDDEGDLQLFGALVTDDGGLLHASSSGDASDALEVGSELAGDVRARLG